MKSNEENILIVQSMAQARLIDPREIIVLGGQSAITNLTF